MRWPRRMRLRSLLALVALIALLLGAERLNWRRQRDLARAAEAAQRLGGERKIIRTLERRLTAKGPGGAAPGDAAAVAETLANRRTWADHYERLERKYRRSASRPWEPTTADPPEPF